jgi:hypothetical protein
MHIVFFHIDGESPRARVKRVPKKLISRFLKRRRGWGDGHLDMAEMMVQSARRILPESRIFQLSDIRTRRVKGVEAVIRGDWCTMEELKIANTGMQRQYMESEYFSENTVFVDTDILFNRDVDHVFSADFHVGLTWRPGFPRMPINYGVIFVKPSAAALVFWRELENFIRRMSPEYKRWYGGQMALATMLGYDRFKGTEPTELAFDCYGAKVRLFSCKHYNFTPVEWPTHVEEEYIVHFKSGMQPFMRSFFEERFPR